MFIQFFNINLQHNTHHAATNVIDHDGDIDLAPLFAFIPGDLCKYKASFEKAILKVKLNFL